MMKEKTMKLTAQGEGDVQKESDTESEKDRQGREGGRRTPNAK